MFKILFIHCFYFLFLKARSCQIAGQESGNCVALKDIQGEINFCSGYLYPYVCVPLYNVFTLQIKIFHSILGLMA